MIADHVSADYLGRRLAVCGRTVISHACPACGGMYLQAEALKEGDRTIGMVVRCSMPGCRAIVDTEYSEEYKAEIEAEEARIEAMRRDAARKERDAWLRRREYT